MRQVVGGPIGEQRLEKPHRALRGESRHGRVVPGSDDAQRSRRVRHRHRGRAEPVGCQRRHGRVIKDVADRCLDPEPLSSPRHQTHRRERCATSMEEVVVPAWYAAAKHGEPEFRDRPLGTIQRPLVSDRSPDFDWLRKRASCEEMSVELAVGGEWQAVMNADPEGNHRRREPGRQPGHKFGGDDRNAGYRHDVPNEERCARFVTPDNNGRLGDERMPGEHRLDLVRLDPMAADLHLPIDSAEVFETAVFAPPSDVTAAVHPATGLGGKRIVDEAFGRQIGPPRITAGEAGAADPDLPGDAHRHRLHRPVEHPDGGASNGTADHRQIGPIARVAVEDLRGDNMALRRAVLVPEDAGGETCEEPADGRADAELLPGDDDFTQ